MYENSHIYNYRGPNSNIVYKKLYFFQFCSLMGQEYKKTGLNLVQTNNLPPVPAKNLVYRIINKVIGRFFKSRQLMTSFKTSASFIAQKIAPYIEAVNAKYMLSD